jgi:hypothetical protein
MQKRTTAQQHGRSLKQLNSKVEQPRENMIRPNTQATWHQQQFSTVSVLAGQGPSPPKMHSQTGRGADAMDIIQAQIGLQQGVR